MNDHHEWTPMIRAFNEEHEREARPLTVEMLAEHPIGSIGKNAWFCKYGFFREDGRWILASYCGHRMTNTHYKEVDLTGKSIYAYDSWDGVGNDDPDHLDHWNETVRRAKRAHLDVWIEK
jgi:hypothetical protein